MSSKSDTFTDQSTPSSGAVWTNDSIVWACLSTARCVFWSLLNDCSKKIGYGVGAHRGWLCCLYCTSGVCQCVCGCECVRRAGATVSLSLSCHGKGSTSLRHAGPHVIIIIIITLSLLLWGLIFFLPNGSCARMAAGASPT